MELLPLSLILTFQWSLFVLLSLFFQVSLLSLSRLIDSLHLILHFLEVSLFQKMTLIRIHGVFEARNWPITLKTTSPKTCPSVCKAKFCLVSLHGLVLACVHIKLAVFLDVVEHHHHLLPFCVYLELNCVVRFSFKLIIYQK